MHADTSSSTQETFKLSVNTSEGARKLYNVVILSSQRYDYLLTFNPQSHHPPIRGKHSHQRPPSQDPRNGLPVWKQVASVFDCGNLNVRGRRREGSPRALGSDGRIRRVQHFRLEQRHADFVRQVRERRDPPRGLERHGRVHAECRKEYRYARGWLQGRVA